MKVMGLALMLFVPLSFTYAGCNPCICGLGGGEWPTLEECGGKLGRSSSLPTGVYGLHLFFSEKEYVDVLTLGYDQAGQKMTGHMHVPNDFDGELENIKVDGEKISFELFVPKNNSRPEDLIFHYEGRFFDKSYRQLIGYVTLKGSNNFVASYTAFLRE